MQISDLFVELGDLLLGESPRCVAIVRSATVEVEKFVDLLEAEAVFLGAFDEPDNLDRLIPDMSGIPRRIVEAAAGVRAVRSTATSAHSPLLGWPVHCYAYRHCEPCTRLQSQIVLLDRRYSLVISCALL